VLTERGFNRDVIEKALSHEPVGIRAVYIVAEYAEQRKKMLQWWADYVDGIVNESKVIVGNFGAIGYLPARAPDLSCSDRLSDGRASTLPPDLSWHPPVTVRVLRLPASPSGPAIWT
jgi:hypothetical protein